MLQSKWYQISDTFFHQELRYGSSDGICEGKRDHPKLNWRALLTTYSIFQILRCVYKYKDASWHEPALALQSYRLFWQLGEFMQGVKPQIGTHKREREIGYRILHIQTPPCKIRGSQGRRVTRCGRGRSVGIFSIAIKIDDSVHKPRIAPAVTKFRTVCECKSRNCSLFMKDERMNLHSYPDRLHSVSIMRDGL